MDTLKRTAKSLSIDAVTASVDTDVNDLMRTLNAALGTTALPCRPLRGMGYSHAAELVNPDTLKRRAVIQYGDAHSKPNVVAEGTESYDAPAVYEALCVHYAGRWYPSRLDPALDFHDEGAFDEAAAILLAFAKERGVTIDQRGDWERGKARTLYLYSRTSNFYVRLYEYRAKHGYGPHCRLEVEVKLKGRTRREALAATPPWEMLSMCTATHRLLVDALDLDLQRIVLTEGPRPPTSVQRDLAFLASTAYPALMRIIAHHSGAIEAAIASVLEYRTETDRLRALLKADPLCDTPGEVTHPETPHDSHRS